MKKLAMHNNLRYSTSILVIMMLIISGLMMSSCSDDKSIKRYKVVNTDDFGNVPLYASAESDEVIGYVPSRTDCNCIEEGCYGDGHKSKMLFANGDTAYVADRYVFEKKFDGVIQDEEIFIISPSDEIANIYSSPSKRKSDLVRSTDRRLIIDSIVGIDGKMCHIILATGEEGWTDVANVSRTSHKVWVENPHAFDKYMGKNKYVDKFLTQIKEWHDSDLHYSIDQMWLYGKLTLWSILFIIACIFAFSQFSDNDRVEWWMQLIVIATGLVLLYYEWQNAIVMGGGYEPTFTESIFEKFNTQSLGWFLNLIVTILLAIVYFICALVILIGVIILQQLIVPLMCITTTGLGKWATIGNALIFCSIYICGVLALLIGPDYYDTLLFIGLAVAVIGIVLGIIGGYQTGNILAIFLIASPVLYLISMATTYCIFKAILYVGAILGVILFVVCAAGTKSKFQSQDDGSTTVVRNQSGQTVGYINKEGWHDGVMP